MTQRSWKCRQKHLIARENTLIYKLFIYIRQNVYIQPVDGSDLFVHLGMCQVHIVLHNYGDI